MSKKKKPASNIVVGGDVTSAITSRKPLFLVGVVVAIFAVVGVGYIVYQRMHTPAPGVQAPAYKDLGSPEQQHQVKDKELQAKLQKATTPESKSSVYNEIASNERSISNYQAAFVATQKAVETQQSADNYAALALAAIQAGNKQVAIDAYQKASELSKDVHERGQSGYEYYQQQKAEIQKTL